MRSDIGKSYLGIEYSCTQLKNFKAIKAVKFKPPLKLNVWIDLQIKTDFDWPKLWNQLSFSILYH